MNHDQKSVVAGQYYFTVKLTFDLLNMKCHHFILLEICIKFFCRRMISCLMTKKFVEYITVALTFVNHKKHLQSQLYNQHKGIKSAAALMDHKVLGRPFQGRI